jgi:hypothetical protein
MRFRTDPNDYSENEWAISAGHYPLAERPRNDTALLHRHWMWANQQREIFDSHVAEASADDLTKMGVAGLATKQLGFMFAWYGMLWSVIQACVDPKESRNIDIRGRFRDDIDHLTPTLRSCRNAILHVPRSGVLLDERIVQLVSIPGSALTLRRITRGFGRLFLEEFNRLDVSKSPRTFTGSGRDALRSDPNPLCFGSTQVNYASM